jgi:hypothetical protein
LISRADYLRLAAALTQSLLEKEQASPKNEGIENHVELSRIFPCRAPSYGISPLFDWSPFVRSWRDALLFYKSPIGKSSESLRMTAWVKGDKGSGLRPKADLSTIA